MVTPPVPVAAHAGDGETLSIVAAELPGVAAAVIVALSAVWLAWRILGVLDRHLKRTDHEYTRNLYPSANVDSATREKHEPRTTADNPQSGHSGNPGKIGGTDQTGATSVDL